MNNKKNSYIYFSSCSTSNCVSYGKSEQPLECQSLELGSTATQQEKSDMEGGENKDEVGKLTGTGSRGRPKKKKMIEEAVTNKRKNSVNENDVDGTGSGEGKRRKKSLSRVHGVKKLKFM